MNISQAANALLTAEIVPQTLQFQLPTVSVIIVNYNYGRFLEQAVASVLDQTYPNIECVVVDNGSTDESPQVLAAIADRYPNVSIIRRANNDGQNAACLDGFDASSGAYVILMDADDVLLAHAVATHIAAHLSLRIPVGLTSGDMLQSVDEQVVLATGQELNRYVRSGKGRQQKDILRPYRDVINSGWPSDSFVKFVAERIHFVPPLTTHWIWSPTSGLCFRRDAMRLFTDASGLAALRTATDVFFSCAIAGLCGGAIIDEPVFIYRIHGSNVLTRQPQLNEVVGIEMLGAGDNTDNAQRLVVDHLVAHAKRFCQTSWSRYHFSALLNRVDAADPDPRLPRWQRRSRAARRLSESYESVVAALGHWLTIVLMLRFRVPIGTICRLVGRRRRRDA